MLSDEQVKTIELGGTLVPPWKNLCEDWRALSARVKELEAKQSPVPFLEIIKSKEDSIQYLTLENSLFKNKIKDLEAKLAVAVGVLKFYTNEAIYKENALCPSGQYPNLSGALDGTGAWDRCIKAQKAITQIGELGKEEK